MPAAHPIEPRPDHHGGHRRFHLLLAILAILLALLLVVILPRAAAAGNAKASLIADGRQEYEESCTGCHGPAGKGDGPLAAKLVKPPRELTTISERNGGTFPIWRTFEIIAGETPVPGHDTHQMPDFHASLKSQDRKPGYLPANVRVLLLTHYLESLQADSASK